MQDLRDAYRALARSKGFTAVAVLSLALALGLNTTVYAVLDAFIHPYVPYRDPGRIIRFAITPNYPATRAISRNEIYLFLRDRARFVEQPAVWNLQRAVVESPGRIEVLTIADVSVNFLDVIGVEAAQGRTFLPGGEDDVVIVSHGAWQRLLTGAPVRDPLTVTINGQSHNVVGVMPPEMNLPDAADLWRPLAPEALALGVPGGSPQLIGRLRDRVSLEDARRDLVTLARELQTARSPGPLVQFASGASTLEPDSPALTKSHVALAGSAVLILLIACANLANLMLARGVSRRRELALRLAIGATRGALVRQLTTEAALLAASGGILGAIWAVWGISIGYSRIPPATFITLSSIHFRWQVLLFACLATSLTVVLFGLFPALRASDVNVAEPLKEGSAAIAGGTPRRYSLLAITQVALALTLLLSAGVLIRSATALASFDPGYPTENLYRTWSDGLNNTVPTQEVVERIRSVPGVTAATVQRWYSVRSVISDRGWSPPEGDSTATRFSFAGMRTGLDYFRTMGIPIVQGRNFDASDGEVVIVDQSVAEYLWPGVSPIGRMVQVERLVSRRRDTFGQLVEETQLEPWRPVIGVSRDIRSPGGFRPTPAIHVFTPYDSARSGSIVFRTDGTPGVASEVAQAIHAAAVLPTLPRVEQVGQDTRNELAAKRFLAGLFVFLGATGLALAALGLYGVLAYAVNRRTREFGIRIALGATERQLFQMVLHDGAVMFLAGTAIGAFTAMAAAQLLDTLLYRVAFTDVFALVASELLLCLVAALACLGPARRAMRTDPLEIMRAT